jgi:hypothetical protein
MADLTHEAARRRTFAIISHPDAGKTTLTEKLLLYSGAIHMAGAVKSRKASRHAVSDWMAMEQERGISITSSVLQFDYRGRRCNLLLPECALNEVEVGARLERRQPSGERICQRLWLRIRSHGLAGAIVAVVCAEGMCAEGAAGREGAFARPQPEWMLMRRRGWRQRWRLGGWRRRWRVQVCVRIGRRERRRAGRRARGFGLVRVGETGWGGPADRSGAESLA